MRSYGAAVVLTALWLSFWVLQWVFQVRFEGETANQFLASSFENLQSEMFQIIVAAWVFKHLLWTGAPESKDTPS